MVEPVRHRRTKGAATDMLEPKTTASHLDFTICVGLAAYRGLPLSPYKQTSLPCVANLPPKEWTGLSCF